MTVDRQQARHTPSAAAEAAGVPLPRARAYWRALGYPAIDDATTEFTDSDVAVLKLVTSYVGDGLVNEPESLRLTRILGRAVSHLARLQVDIVAGRLSYEPGGRAQAVHRLTHQVMPEVLGLLSTMLNRHMSTALEAIGDDEQRLRRPVLGVGFADIVGFTELSRDRSDLELMRMVEHFEDRTADTIGDCGGAVIKLLGDEVLFTADDPAVAADIATRLAGLRHEVRDFPSLRVGVAWGPVVRHLGDIFGTTVNLASRLTRMAEPDTVLISPPLAEALADHACYRLETLAHTDIRGIGVTAPTVLRRG